MAEHDFLMGEVLHIVAEGEEEEEEGACFASHGRHHWQ
jgi:hypothetical protein